MLEGPEVVVVGNVGIDTNVYLDRSDLRFREETLFTDNRDLLGQAGGYASRGYAALGRRTAFIGSVGDDPPGRAVREVFARDGIDTRGLFLDPAGTARSVNFMFPDGRRKGCYDGKGHRALRPDLGACRQAMAGAALAHFNIPDWARGLLPEARKLGLVVACDLQDMGDPDDAYRADFIAAADILFFSAANHRAPGPLVRALLARRPQAVVVAGMGPKGCMLGASGRIRRFPAPPLDLPIRDCNGAGDSLAVGFLASRVLEGRSLEESILRGQIAARHCCALRGTSDGLITRGELEARARALEA